MATELWLDDLRVGHRFRTDVYDLTADDIIEFAIKWDPQPFHISDESAQDTFFMGSRAAADTPPRSRCACSSRQELRWRAALSAPAVRSPGPPRRDRAIDFTSRAKSST
ncbi:hypothetical protein [Mycobacterium sp.]|uniref:hypothetical protein n=1 Tax=Mycobacterium sp. TaxID=1785 RepID=UPI003BB11FBF